MAPPKVSYSITPNPSVSPILDDQICRTIEETFGDFFCAPDDTLTLSILWIWVPCLFTKFLNNFHSPFKNQYECSSSNF